MRLVHHGLSDIWEFRPTMAMRMLSRSVSALLAATWLLGGLAAVHADTAAPALAHVERRDGTVRVFPRPASRTLSAVAGDVSAPSATSTFRRVTDTSVLPNATVGYLDIVLLNGVTKRCSGIAVAAKVVMTSASCLKPGRDIDGALAAQIQFTAGLTQAASGGALTSAHPTQSYHHYEMLTPFYDGVSTGPDFAAITFSNAVTSATSFVDVANSLGRVPSSASVIGYATTSAGETGSLAQWQSEGALLESSERRLIFPIPYDSALSGAPVIENGSLVGFAVSSATGGLAASRMLDSDKNHIRRWIGLPALHESIETGWWWAPSEPGRGYFIEVNDDRMFFGMVSYGADGRPSWRVAYGAMATTRSFQGELVGYANGTTIGAAYRAPAPQDAVPVELTFQDGQTAMLTLPWTRVALERFPVVPFGPGFGASESPYPETGFWWNPSEPGTGVVLEVQGNKMMIGLLDYDTAGRARWTYAVNDMIFGLLFVAPILDVATGPPDGRSWHQIGDVMSGQNIVVEVKSRTRIVLVQPDGTRVSLERFPF